MAQHHGDQPRNRGCRRDDDMVDRRRGIPAGASTDRTSCWLDRGLAVLRPAPVRGHGLGSWPRLEPARGGASRQFAL